MVGRRSSFLVQAVCGAVGRFEDFNSHKECNREMAVLKKMIGFRSIEKPPEMAVQKEMIGFRSIEKPREYHLGG